MKEQASPSPSRNAPCPCGSGKKYKRCCGARAAAGGKKPGSWSRPLIAVAVLVVLIIGGMLVSKQTSGPGLGPGPGPGAGFGGPAYTELLGVEMAHLSAEQRAQVMQRANRDRCTCGCGMTLSRCINTDTTCPIRRQNFQRARRLVVEAERGS